MNIGPAMAWLGNARQDSLDAGEAGEWDPPGLIVGLGGVTIPGKIVRDSLGRERAQQSWPEVGGVLGSAAIVFPCLAWCQGHP